jgi:predicted HAD superfamily phosphohydrolase
MQIFHKSRLLFWTFSPMIISPTKSYSDISKAFPDMSNVFEKVSFYDKIINYKI